MKLFSLVLVALAAFTVSADEVQHLRGEKEAQKDESAVGVAVKEPATQEEEGPNDAADAAIGVPEKELESSSDDDVDEGVELTLEELDAEDKAEAPEGQDKSAWPGRPGRPGGPIRRRRPGVGCRQWVTCVNGWWGGFRCSGNRYCRLWR